MEKQQLISKIIKISIGILFAVFFVVLLAQYITMAQISNKQSKLDAQIEAQQEELDKKTAEYDELSDADKYNEYVTDYVRDNFDRVAEDEVLINKH